MNNNSTNAKKTSGIDKYFATAIQSAMSEWLDVFTPGCCQVSYCGLTLFFSTESDVCPDLLSVGCDQALEDTPRYDLLADSCVMPFCQGCLNLLVLPLSLELAGDPARLMREAEYSLTDGGRLLLYGINPWSPWSISHRFVHRNHLPPSTYLYFQSRRRVREWLCILGFEIEREISMLYGLPARQNDKFSRYEHYARQFLPGCGMLYGIQAIKRVVPLTKIRPSRARVAFQPVETA